LFISMRSGASVDQLLADSVEPRGARTVRVLSRRLDMVISNAEAFS
jgi:hypothetical protein